MILKLKQQKAFMPYFEVLQDGCVKRPCNADLVFSS